MSKFECELVNDLLPSYIEKKTSSQTNQFIEEHFRSCDECRELYEAMIEEVSIKNQPMPYKKKFRINSIGKMILIVLGYLAVVIIGLVVFTYIMTNGVI
ncbi:Putative zinc-finger [Pseudobutyrivibrio sp. 49]|uniref:zf-HC2 domain-containing protein n=1 Tax=unclassified Pseudobutyrivibrio TaxID=2638619 RepID=UPI0008842470|nr:MULTISPECIES: zf-HC2 domain-containing protein [unclassified Pseudobutyrivibrio]SDH72934.1 Putative zinc-finger [Pseudobutyrivibrio sp. 49]SFN75321.1 Putative zinc-finger [Pseudobutyrivibrio sp. UC1225]